MVETNMEQSDPPYLLRLNEAWRGEEDAGQAADESTSVHKPPRLTGYLMMQKPCASMPSGTLNLLRKFSSATAAVSSTIWASS